MSKQGRTDQAPFDQHVFDLINLSIDGQISSTEQEELEHLLATSKSALKLNEELRSVTRMLDELPEVEPPHYLQSAIERQVRLPVTSKSNVQKPGSWAGWLNANWLRTGVALAAGVVLTIGVYEMGSEPVSDRDAANMSGTMIRNGHTAKPELLVDSISLSTGKLNGLVELHNRDGVFTLDVRLISDGPSELIVNFARSGLEIDGVSRMQHPVEAVAIADGTIHFTSSGEQHYVVTLRRLPQLHEPAPLELEFFADSKLVQQSKLNVPGF